MTNKQTNEKELYERLNAYCQSEDWEVLSDFDYYAFSIRGDMINVKTNKFLKRLGNPERYCLRRDGKTITVYVKNLLEREFGITDTTKEG
jgi:hypothetical protein